MKTIKVSEADYRDLCDEYGGVCLACGELSWIGGVEPDAENYPCDDCGENAVMGAEQALLLGHLEIIEPEESESE